MRIIAGKHRGRKLFPPEGGKVRPTADRAREALFSILGHRIGSWTGVRMLDVFCGTGAFGLEAVSRGAEKACFIDIDTASVRKNADLWAEEKSKIKIVQADAQSLPRADAKYNLAFLDAPYNKGLTATALRSLHEKGWLAENALIVAETEKSEALEAPSPWELLDERTYGSAKFWIFRLH